MNTPTSTLLGIGAALPEYQIVEELGRGSMGVVYLGRHRKLGRDVAIKELPKSLASDPGVRVRFAQEACTLGQLNHPHVVTVYDFIDRDGHLALVMEKLGGGTVWDRFVSLGVSTATACGLVLSAAAGLDHAHSHGVLHRDVKPENLMFTDSGQLKVTDFGIAKAIAGDRTMATADGTILGTPAYMSPEQAEGLPVGPAADVYACGTILYEMLCGQLPFADAQTPMALLLSRVRAEAPPIEVFSPSIPKPIARVVNKAVARSIEHRYQSVQQFAVALGHAAASTWGLEWLRGCGVAVSGSEPIERAARTTGDRRSVIDITDATERARESINRTPHLANAIAGAGTVTTPADASTHPSLEGFSEDQMLATRATVAMEGPTARPNHGIGPTEGVSVSTHSSQRQPSRPEIPTITPSQIHSQEVVDFSHISARELVDIGEIRRRSKAAPLWLMSAAFTMIMVAWIVISSVVPAPEAHSQAASTALTPNSLTINGYSLSEDNNPIPLDLSRHMTVGGLGDANQVNLAASSLGIPLGSVNGAVRDGRTTLAPGKLQWTTTGIAQFTLSTTSQDTERQIVTFKAMTTHRWWTTLQTLLISMTGLAASAWFGSCLIKLSHGSFHPSWLIGASIATGTLGAALGVLAGISQGPGLYGISVLAAAIPAALAGATFAEGFRCFHRFRRIHRGLVD